MVFVRPHPSPPRKRGGSYVFPYSSSPNLERVPGDEAIYDNIGCALTLTLYDFKVSAR